MVNLRVDQAQDSVWSWWWMIWILECSDGFYKWPGRRRGSAALRVVCNTSALNLRLQYCHWFLMSAVIKTSENCGNVYIPLNELQLYCYTFVLASSYYRSRLPFNLVFLLFLVPSLFLFFTSFLVHFFVISWIPLSSLSYWGWLLLSNETLLVDYITLSSTGTRRLLFHLISFENNEWNAILGNNRPSVMIGLKILIDNFSFQFCKRVEIKTKQKLRLYFMYFIRSSCNYLWNF